MNPPIDLCGIVLLPYAPIMPRTILLSLLKISDYSYLPSSSLPLPFLSPLLLYEPIKSIVITGVLAMFSPISPSISFMGHLKSTMMASDRIRHGVNQLIVDLRP